MAELPDGFVFDLADTLSGHAEDLAHLFQGVGTAVVHTEAHPQHVGFPLGKRPQNFLQGLGKQRVGGGIGRAGSPLRGIRKERRTVSCNTTSRLTEGSKPIAVTVPTFTP